MPESIFASVENWGDCHVECGRIFYLNPTVPGVAVLSSTTAVCLLLLFFAHSV